MALERQSGSGIRCGALGVESDNLVCFFSLRPEPLVASLLLVAMLGAPSSVLAPTSKARRPSSHAPGLN